MRKLLLKKGKKSLLSIVLGLLVLFPTYSASMKEYVCIVSRNVSEQSRNFLEQYRDNLKSAGYKDYANKVDGYLNGTFGSGFVYLASDKKPYIITNRHVVSNAETADVKFEKEDGTYQEFVNLPIIAVDDSFDIAVIALPDDFEKKGLTVSQLAINDGDDVWSAGFPALGDKPVWQFGKGIITNSSARIKELIDPNVSTIIQHSAEIDSGNSGGPLLVKNTNTDVGYSVIGINTWKASNRQNTNYSIPAKLIDTYIKTNVTNVATEVDINARLLSFSKAIKNTDIGYSGLAVFISNEMVSLESGKMFLNVLNKAPYDIQNEIINIFTEDPLEGLKYTIAYDIWKQFHKTKELNFSVSTPESVENGNKIVFTVGEKDIDSLWTMYQGTWRMKEFGNYNETYVLEKARKDAMFNISNNYAFKISGGIAIPLGKEKMGYDFSALRYIDDYFGMGVFIHSEQKEIKYSNWPEKDKYVMHDTTAFGFEANGAVPLNFKYITVEPRGMVRVGLLDFFEFFNKDIEEKSKYETEMFYFGVGAGLGLTVSINPNLAFTVGADYLHSFYEVEEIGDIMITAGVKLLRK